MKIKTGRVRRKLAALLQKNFPVSAGGLALTWEPDQLYPATGSYRTNWMLDCARWEGFARHYRTDGTYWTVLDVHSYEPMSELIKSDKLTIAGNGEVTFAKEYRPCEKLRGNISEDAEETPLGSAPRNAKRNSRDASCATRRCADGYRRMDS